MVMSDAVKIGAKVILGGLYFLPSGSIVKATSLGHEDVNAVADQAGEREVVRCTYVKSLSPHDKTLTVLRLWFEANAIQIPAQI